MSPNRKLVKAIQNFYHQNCKHPSSAIKEQSLWLLRNLLITRKQPDWVNAGFILPTVAMVSLVVVLLTIAILFRSFERSKNASNVRVNEAVLNAAAPANDRARAKLDALFEDPTLPRGTPSDSALYDALKKDKYRLGDETRLKLAYNINSDSDIDLDSTLENDETLKTAWKFAVDTDNNGLKDSYVLYGIYFRSPSRNSSGNFTRERSPLDARTPPMDNDSNNQQCSNAAGFSSLVGNSSWFKLQSGNLGKSFFVYTVNVPITQTEMSGLDNAVYEAYKGNKGFVALEFQQDRSRIPLPNNAVWFENDLEIVTGNTELKLNGRIHTNSNLLVAVTGSQGNIKLRQVSSKSSCFYNQENGQISVGGNVGNGSLAENTVKGITVDLYQGFGKDVITADINNTNKSTDSTGGSQIGFNDAAYNERIARMKTDALDLCTNCQSATTANDLKTAVNSSSYPEEVKNNVAAKVKNDDDITTAKDVLADEIEIYLRNRTRKVPFAEVPDPTGTGALTGYTTITASLEPQQTWREPLDSNNKLTGTSITVETSKLEATYPNLQKQEGVQTKLGDRIFVGNNLPARWLQGSTYVGSEANQYISGVNWDRPTDNPKQRWRNTQIQAISDLGISDRNGFWEEKAAENPLNPLDSVGGVRIVTGAGIYVDGSGTSNTTTGPFYGRDDYSFLTTPNPSDDTVVWPDTMPMFDPQEATKKGDLLMRATAVYHYKISFGKDQEPIACVSSYYDSTDETTAKNKVNKDGGYGVDTTKGRSNNGVVYNFPGRSEFGTNKARLLRQANLKYPNGRWVNQPLKDALEKIGTGTTVPSTGLQLADYSAIDTALCAIEILENESNFVATPSNQPPHGAIREASFLDGREVKQISTSASPTDYNLDLEQRQPLEVRVTDIDLGQLADTVITNGGTTEYLLPYSGIIYATRDDALRDASKTYDESDRNSVLESELLSPTDFKLDPTRRPSGIRLINGATLARKPGTNNNAYEPKEKGLILATNLPAYVKGKFNLHRTSTSSTTEIEEFTQTEPTTNFYNRSTANTAFACRLGRTGCPATEGDYWRPATIIADAITLLSGGFKDGFRSEGDYDLNNNTGIVVARNLDPDSFPSNLYTTLDERNKRLKNGFWENSFATSAEWWQAPDANEKIFPKTEVGSYVKNGVTPIQRRAKQFSEYLMEVCIKLPVDRCGSGDWYVDPNPADPAARKKASDVIGQTFDISIHKAGTTAELAAPEYRRYPRRVAFKRNSSNELQQQGNNYIPLGISGTDETIKEYPYTGSGSSESPRLGNNALWFRTTGFNANPSTDPKYGANYKLFYYRPFDGSDPDNNPDDLTDQPLLVPVLQIHEASRKPPDLRNDNPSQIGDDFRLHWLQVADANTTFNATFVLGNSPGRGVEISAGLQNLVRFLESWFYQTDDPKLRTAKISGSFIQLKRSAYATAPLAPIFTARQANTADENTNNLSVFDYPLDTYSTPNASGISPFYNPPDRNWGFDVGLLSEQPDLFAQRFTLPPTGRPNEFFREVGRDDSWVKTLLCAGQADNQTGIATTAGTTITYNRAVPTEYRPSSCPSIPSDN